MLIPSVVIAVKLMIEGTGYKLSNFMVDIDTELKPYIYHSVKQAINSPHL